MLVQLIRHAVGAPQCFNPPPASTMLKVVP